MDWAAFDLADPKLLKVLQAHGWSWSAAAEAENRSARQAFLAPVERLIREGQATGLFRRHVAVGDALAAIWAIYTFGMREAVFADVVPGAQDAIAAIWGQIEAVLVAG
jgi:hypothetical protein